MEITPIGWILLPLAAMSYWFAPRILYPLAIFFLPFSATAIVNVGSADSASGVLASMLFGSLWIAKELPQLGQFPATESRRLLRRPVFQLGLFVFVVLLSLLVPFWVDGHFVIENPELGDTGSAPLQFTTRHITQTLYLVYGIVFTIFVAFRNSDSRQLLRSIRIFMVSAVFVSLWGFLQFACGMLNLEYPAFIFNTSKTESALGYTQEIREIGLTRISSVATEPSMFAQCMLIAVVIALFMIVNPQPLFSKKFDRLALAIILGALLISTSTTAYLGLAGVLVLYALALAYLRVLRAKFIIPVLAFLGILGLIFAMIFPVANVFQSVIVEKGESYSVLARVNSVLLARDYFLQFPILGLGWGSVTSHDLVFKLLSNTGVAGLCAFSLFVMTSFVRLWRSARSNKVADSNKELWSVCILISLTTLILTSIAGDFAFTYGHVWFVFGLAIAVPVLNQASEDAAPGLKTLNPQITGPR